MRASHNYFLKSQVLRDEENSDYRKAQMNIELRKWNTDYREELIRICNTVDRSYLSNRMPDPYTEADADWWLGMVAEHDENDGIFRAVYVDGLLAGTVSVEQKTDVHCKDGEIGYYLSTDYWRRGIMTEAVEKVCLLAFEKIAGAFL